MNNRRSNTNDVRMRQRIAAEAARIMSEEHLSDFYRAKHKAAARLGAANTRNLPRNDEIEKALVEYQSLFRADSQPLRLKRLRETALRAMEFLAAFNPRLVGSVLRGTADEHAEVTLHVFADTPEEDDRGRQHLLDYFRHCVLRAFPDDPAKMPPTMHYFMKINEILRGATKETLSDKSILIGPPEKIVETLKRVEADGIDEVILYFNVGRKPHALVKEQMHRFAEEIAPAFAAG